jgi:gamma-glutamyl-gamma-aminobutyraldehyde dehydrogenase
VISEKQLDGVLTEIARAQQEGAALRLGGSRARVESGGFFLDPTVFDAVDNASQPRREEVFGPVWR